QEMNRIIGLVTSGYVVDRGAPLERLVEIILVHFADVIRAWIIAVVIVDICFCKGSVVQIMPCFVDTIVIRWLFLGPISSGRPSYSRALRPILFDGTDNAAARVECFRAPFNTYGPLTITCAGDYVLVAQGDIPLSVKKPMPLVQQQGS